MLQAAVQDGVLSSEQYVLVVITTFAFDLTFISLSGLSLFVQMVRPAEEAEGVLALRPWVSHLVALSFRLHVGCVGEMRVTPNSGHTERRTDAH